MRADLPVAALELIRRGYYVFPCRPRTKKPANEHGYLEATADAMAVKRTWEENPHANIGVACGASGIVGFDPAESLATDGEGGPELTEADLALLRELASGSSDRSPEVDDLLARLGVATENEAIQYAIKAGVTWQ